MLFPVISQLTTKLPIGERGINLSGGQKQRVSMARAAYSNANVIIMDDPLSALDPEVAMKLFDECIVKFLKGKTRLLVTNQLQCLPKCDTVIALGKRGNILEQGRYEDLIKVEEGEVKRLLKDLAQKAENKSSEKKGAAVSGVPVPDKSRDAPEAQESLQATEHAGDKKPEKMAQVLVTKEEREMGSVKLQIYLKYIRAGGGLIPFIGVFIGYVLATVAAVLTNVWISLWTSDTDYERHGQGFYLGMYAFTAVMLGVLTFARSYFFAIFGVEASKKLHGRVLKSIFRAPMSFFDTTPTGRILARFSKDMYSIDQELTEFFDWFIYSILTVLATMGTIIFATPFFALPLVPMAISYVAVINYFRRVSRESKRLESIARSPVYSQFSETLGGLSTIRAYGEASKFINNFGSKLNSNTRASYVNKTSERWLSTRLELIGALVTGVAAIFSTQVIVSNGATGVGGTSNFASLAGLSLSFSISITGLLQWMVRAFAQLEAGMNSCERVLYYTEHIPSEAAVTSDELEKDTSPSNPNPPSNSATKAVMASGGKVIYPTEDWPDKGAIALDNLLMRYRKETPLVLKGLTVRIAGGERVGVVGRTGSGKSSLLLCLMRLVEPELDEGGAYKAPLTIDGVDALRIGLLDLRSKIGIIPQSPVLFSGTIRSNMDPFNNYTDDEIWHSLEKCGMKQTVEAMPDELYGPVAEYGENLSQGQRQLLCLGRALLKKCHVLLLDEATSSVDYETDQEIQRTIREAFKDSTVLTIAHRVDTIMDSDKILVMSDGLAAEFAPPQELLADEKSLFSDIVRHSQKKEGGSHGVEGVSIWSKKTNFGKS
jgi:ABC-type multidrug transport system fused ATPase/permease subunit